MRVLSTRIKALERRALPRPEVITCMYFRDEGYYQVGPKRYTRAEFIAHYGGTPEEKCVGVLFDIGSDEVHEGAF